MLFKNETLKRLLQLRLYYFNVAQRSKEKNEDRNNKLLEIGGYQKGRRLGYTSEPLLNVTDYNLIMEAGNEGFGKMMVMADP